MNLAEKNAIELGFKKFHEYEHDGFFTKRFKLRYIKLDFTYKGENLYSIDCCIDEVFALPLNKKDLTDLVRILDKAN